MLVDLTQRLSHFTSIESLTLTEIYKDSEKYHRIREKIIRTVKGKRKEDFKGLPAEKKILIDSRILKRIKLIFL